jgi:hypothetical protein
VQRTFFSPALRDFHSFPINLPASPTDIDFMSPLAQRSLKKRPKGLRGCFGIRSSLIGLV